jgi:hypothetical protein
MRIVRSLVGAALLAMAPFTLAACAFDTTDDHALESAKHSQLVTHSDDSNGDTTKVASTPPAATQNPEPSPWKAYKPNTTEPEPSPWGGQDVPTAPPNVQGQPSAQATTGPDTRDVREFGGKSRPQF